jgi:hypothetical protein
MNFPVQTRSTAAGQSAQLQYCYIDNGSMRYFGTSDGLINGQTTFRLHAFNASTTYLSTSQITSTLPFTWISGDIIHIFGSYEVA